MVPTRDTPAERIGEVYDWDTVLTADGWTHTSTHSGHTRWARPGKQSWGHSAVLHDNGPFVVFSTEAPPELLNAGVETQGDTWSVTLFAYIAATRHDNNRSQAAKEVRRLLNETSNQ